MKPKPCRTLVRLGPGKRSVLLVFLALLTIMLLGRDKEISRIGHGWEGTLREFLVMAGAT